EFDLALDHQQLGVDVGIDQAQFLAPGFQDRRSRIERGLELSLQLDDTLSDCCIGQCRRIGGEPVEEGADRTGFLHHCIHGDLAGSGVE
ncbi:hypothetical protein ABTN76_19670, partial [Acinetobacter baumannii]